MVTRSLLVSIQKRKKLYRKLLNSPNPVRESQYKIYRNHGQKFKTFALSMCEL
jgi:hypothetical protein